MNNLRRSRLGILIVLVIVCTAIATESREIVGQFNTNDENPFLQVAWEHQTMPLYYACERGNYEPACNAINDNSQTQIVVYNFEQQTMPLYYACVRGNYEPACKALNLDKSPAVYEFLPMRYACLNGGYEPACIYIGNETPP